MRREKSSRPDGFNMFIEHVENLNDWRFSARKEKKCVCIVEVTCVHYFDEASLDMAESQPFIFYVQFSPKQLWNIAM